MRLSAVFVVIAMVLFALVPAASAQSDPVNSATFTENFLNAQIQANQQPNANLTDLSVDLQPGQIVLVAMVTGRQGNPLEMSLTLVPLVVDGRVTFEATVFMLGGFELDLTQFQANPNAAAAVGAVQDVVGEAAQNNRIQSVTVTADALTLTWLRANPDAPRFDLVDTRISMTVTASYVNDLPGVSNPGNPLLADLVLDFQPGQLMLTGTRTVGDNPAAPFSVTMVPTLNNGLITWTIIALVVDGAPTDAQAIGQMNDDIVGSWRMLFDSLYRSGSLTAIDITDSTLTLTWDTTLANDTPGFENGQGTLVIEEQYLNSAYRVTDPPTYRITDETVDCQPGQVVVSANLNLNNGTILQQVTTFVPSIENGVVIWLVSAVTLDGEPLDPAIIDRFNEAILGWWNGVLWGQLGDYQATNVTVTDTQVEITYRSR